MYKKPNSNDFSGLKATIVRIVLVIIGVVVAYRLLLPGFDPVKAVARKFKSEMQSYIDDGKDALAAGDYVVARGYFSKAVELEPKNLEIHYLLAESATRYGDYNLALADLQKAVDIDPNYAPAYYAMGRVYMINRVNDGAMINFAKAIEINPDYFQALLARGNMYNESKRYTEAIADFEHALEVMPSDTLSIDTYIANTNLAWSYMHSNRELDGIKAYNRAIDANTDHVGVLQASLPRYQNQIDAFGSDSQEATEFRKLLDRIDAINGKH